MGKIEQVMRSEITRLARKEVRPLFTPLNRQLRDLAKQVRSLSATTDRLDRMVRRLESARVEQVGRLEVSEQELRRTRMSPGLIKKLRRKLDITQDQLAALVDVSPAAVQSWEQGIARPTGENRAALVALRNVGRRDVGKLLQDKGVTQKRKPRTQEKRQAASGKKASKKTARETSGRSRKKASKKASKSARRSKSKSAGPRGAAAGS